MDPLAAHQRAQDAFSGVLANVEPQQLDDPTPCRDWAVRDLIEHVIGGNERVAIRAGLGSEPPDRPGGLIEAHRATAAAAQAVFAAPGRLTTTFELPSGPVSGSAFIWIRTSDALAHAWDLAKATDQPTGLDPELATYLLAAARENLPSGLRGRYYDDPQPCDQARPPADKLAAFLGRTVD
jgi:uncharacterized protein (TIGR03086 family)